MKKFTVVLIAALLFAASFAGPALAAIEVEGDAYVGVFDKYMWRGIDLSNSQPVLQGGVDLSAAGFTLSYWSNIQLSSGDDFTSDETTETDIVLDYSFDASELLSVSVGDIYYSFNVPGSTHELYLGLALNTLLSPSFTAYYDWDAADDADLDGLYYDASVSHGFDLAEGLSLSLGALVSYNDESPFVGEFSDWNNYELSASIDYAVNDQVSVTPSFVFSSPISDEAKVGIDSETTGGVSLTLTF